MSTLSDISLWCECWHWYYTFPYALVWPLQDSCVTMLSMWDKGYSCMEVFRFVWTNTSPLAIFSAPHLDYSVPSQCPPTQLVSFCCFQCRVAGKMGHNVLLEIILFICYIVWGGGGESNTWRLGDKVTHDNCVVFWVLNRCFFLFPV